MMCIYKNEKQFYYLNKIKISKGFWKDQKGIVINKFIRMGDVHYEIEFTSDRSIPVRLFPPDQLELDSD